MASFLDMIMVSRVNRYVSMRVHGTSAHVQAEPPPDNPDTKLLNIERVPQGTLISGNYPAHMSVHFSIPTPLTVERTESFLTLPGLTQPSTPVFRNTSVRVVRIQLFLTASHSSFGTLRAMDGNRLIAKANMDDLDILIPSDDEYIEESFPLATYTLDLDKRVYTALGVSFDVGFTHAAFGDPEHTQILLIGAKAVFRS